MQFPDYFFDKMAMFTKSKATTCENTLNTGLVLLILHWNIELTSTKTADEF